MSGQGGGRLALYTVAHPTARPFLAAWWRSVEAQTDADFDLWISVDGLDLSEVERLVGNGAARLVPVAPGTSKAGVREQAMRELSERYPAVVFVDADDLLAPSRVAAARAELGGCDVVACALDVVDEMGREVGVRFAPPAGAALHQLQVRRNVFGLSNTAYRSEVLRRCLPLPRDAVLIDWLLASRAGALGATLAFDPVPRMRYRQYGRNTARVIPPFTAGEVLAATRLVRGHYRTLLDEEWPLPPAARGELRAARQAVERFGDAVERDPALLDGYVAALNRLEPEFVWWWCVAHPALEGMWTS